MTLIIVLLIGIVVEALKLGLGLLIGIGLPLIIACWILQRKL